MFISVPKNSFRILFGTLSLLGGISAMILVFEILYDYNSQLFYDSDRYRIENSFKGILAPASLPELFIKKGIFEKKFLLKGSYIPKDKITEIKILELANDSVEVKFFHTDTLRNSISSPLICKIKIE